MNNLFIGVLLLSSFTPQQLEAKEPPSYTIEQMIDMAAESHSIATTTLYNLIWAESRLDPKADNGYDRGLAQINREAWPEITDEQAFDPEWALNWTAQKIADGESYIWTVCNCYSYASTLTGKLPRMAEIQPNTTIPRIGEIAIFNYRGKKHIGVLNEITEDGFFIKEANYTACSVGRRFIKWDDPAFIGFYSLGTS
jgi:hypothetical protein